MSRFVEGEDRRQPTLLPSCLDDYVSADNSARVIDAFVDELDLAGLGFVVAPATTGRWARLAQWSTLMLPLRSRSAARTSPI